MERWNGWGETCIDYHLPAAARIYLEERVGKGHLLEDISLEHALKLVPRSRLSHHPLIVTDPLDRLTHARGQSLPDWVALRSGEIGGFPDGVAFPNSDDEVRVLLEFARQVNAKVIPYGGGTSVVGHINPIFADSPVLTMDLTRLNNLLDIDECAHLATFGAGVAGPALEAVLNSRGYTLGHFPQSFEYSTLGGWVVTRSTGQQSYHYGRIEELFAGGCIETPAGRLTLPAHPASAAGPDLRQIILGSEGRMGVLTRATVRISPLPEREFFYGAFFHSWKHGIEAVRTIVQEGIKVSMLRLSDPLETVTTLALAGKERLIGLADSGLRLLKYGEERCLLIFGVTGSRRATHEAYRRACAVIRDHHGLMTGTFIGRMWSKSRFHTPYLRNTLWEAGYALDTLETAVPWSRINPLAEALIPVLENGLQDDDERVLAFSHLSHGYRDGVSLYVTYLWRRDSDPAVTLHRWQILKKAASEIILRFGGTISHQHGVGIDHAPYLIAEKGELGMRSLEMLCKTFDPDGLMNPGKLIQS